MTATIALVGLALLIGLAVVIGRVEHRSTEQAWRNIARQRRVNGEERRRLLAWEQELHEWQRHLEQRQEDLDEYGGMPRT